MNQATGKDLTDRSLRPLTTAEVDVGKILLGDAWSMIIAQRPHVAERVYTDPTFRALIIQIQCSMVLRVLRNPDGKLEEQIDDYRWRRDSAISSGALYITDAELALVGNGSAGSDGAWTINTRPRRERGFWQHPDIWVPIS